MNEHAAPHRQSAHRIAWSAIGALLWMPGLAFAVMGVLQWFGLRGLIVNQNLTFLASGLAVFTVLFAIRVPVTPQPAWQVEVDRIFTDDTLSSRAKVRRLFGNWLFYLQLLVLTFWLIAVLVPTGR